MLVNGEMYESPAASALEIQAAMARSLSGQYSDDERLVAAWIVEHGGFPAYCSKGGIPGINTVAGLSFLCIGVDGKIVLRSAVNFLMVDYPGDELVRDAAKNIRHKLIKQGKPPEMPEDPKQWHTAIIEREMNYGLDQ